MFREIDRLSIFGITILAALERGKSNGQIAEPVKPGPSLFNKTPADVYNDFFNVRPVRMNPPNVFSHSLCRIRKFPDRGFLINLSFQLGTKLYFALVFHR